MVLSNYLAYQSAGDHVAPFYRPQEYFAPKPHATKNDNHQDTLEPFMNLVASHHNAYIVPSKEGLQAVAEIEMSDNESESTVDTELQTDPDRQINVVDSTTTMGAVTLLAFLNLLGYIQNVLGGTGRKKRSIPDEGYLTSTTHRIPLAPVPTFFEEVLRGLGIWAEQEEERQAEEQMIAAESRMDGVIEDEPSYQKGSWGNLFSHIGRRFRLASNVMHFLTDPEPTRIRRSVGDALQRASRSKRFTSAMNAWYDELAGQNYDGESHSSMQGSAGPSSDLLSMLMLGIGKQLLGR